MADWDVAFRWMMRYEDPEFLYEKEPDDPDEFETDEQGKKIRVGAYAISGVNSAAYPVQFARINAIRQDLRGPAVSNFYRLMFWNKWYDQIVSNEVAKRTFSTSVNVGPETGVMILQRAVNAIGGAQIDDDGHWGPITVTAVNNQNEASLVSSLQAQILGYYKSVADEHPAKAKYLGTAQHPGPWWRRAMD